MTLEEREQEIIDKTDKIIEDCDDYINENEDIDHTPKIKLLIEARDYYLEARNKLEQSINAKE